MHVQAPGTFWLFSRKELLLKFSVGFKLLFISLTIMIFFLFIELYSTRVTREDSIFDILLVLSIYILYMYNGIFY